MRIPLQLLKIAQMIMKDTPTKQQYDTLIAIDTKITKMQKAYQEILRLAKEIREDTKSEDCLEDLSHEMMNNVIPSVSKILGNIAHPGSIASLRQKLLHCSSRRHGHA